uniref:hypothetical protein n=1 Tax=Enterococcus faecium TaxID=1352 RepID=UPI003DA19DD9
YVPLVFVSTLQSTYFVADSTGTIVAKWSQGVGGTHTATGVLPQTMFYSSDKFIITSQFKNKAVSENGTFFGLLGVTSTVLD